jgi:hypothetical protein
MGKSNLIAALNNATIYNSLLKGCKVCFNPFTVKRPKRTKDKFIGNIYTLVSVLSIRGLHVSKSGKSICCEVEYSDSNNETNITKLYVTFNDDKTVLILHSNNNTWGIISTDYKYISDPINDTENM